MTLFSSFPLLRFLGIWLLSGPAWGGEILRTEEGYRIPGPDFSVSSPSVHGSHPEYRIEWWYLTGHLFAKEESKRRFGIQATFFRFAQRPPVSGEKTRDGEESGFGDGQFYLAHMGLTDVEGGEFFHEERLNREGWDAGAKVGDLDVHNGNWFLRRESGFETIESSEGVLALSGSILSDAGFDLRLELAKAAVRFGEGGLSRKSSEESAVSYYVTFPRLLVGGEVRLGAQVIPVTGEMWMDHEISSSQLGGNQVGWDWASIQFSDGRELMAYVLRKPDGSVDSHSSLTWIDEEGNLSAHRSEEFEWHAEGAWSSPETGDVYPIRPRIVTTDPRSGEIRRLRLRPVLEKQEISGSLGGVAYWEGACDVVDEDLGQVVGRGYLELTGYSRDDDLKTRLRGQ